MERPINPPPDGRDRPSPGSLVNAALPIVALLVFGLSVAATLAVAGDTLGYDFLAYHAAAARVLDGRPLYDLAYDVAGPSGLFLYPPVFLPLVLVFGLLPASAATWAWIALLLVAFALGIALLPVSRRTRWVVVLLAGQSWPFLYNLKLGQVGPLLFLLFVIGWRWMDRPRVLGAAGALGAAIKLQPGLVLAWALLTRRWAAVAVGAVVLAVLAVLATVLAGPQSWPDYVTLIGRVSDPITTPHNATPGAVAFQLGATRDIASLVQWASTGLAVAAVAWAALRMALGSVLSRRGHRQPAAVADPVGPLRDAAAAAGGVAGGPGLVVGDRHHRGLDGAPGRFDPGVGVPAGALGLPGWPCSPRA